MAGDFKTFEDNLFNSIKNAEETSIEVLKSNLTSPSQVQSFYPQTRFSPFLSTAPSKQDNNSRSNSANRSFDSSQDAMPTNL